jgi:multiple antibiotic resistance protein
MNIQALLEYTMLAFGTLFVIVDPIATVPAFLAITPHDTPEQRVRAARLASLVMAGVLLVFAVAGKIIFKFFGITMPAFQIAASVVLMMVALDMLRAQRSRVQETTEETSAGAEKTDIAITPLAIPMLAGPGAISSAILLQTKAHGVDQHIALYVCICAVAFVSYITFRISAHGAKWLNPIAMKITTRIMGLLLAAVAVQFMINGIKAVRADWIQLSPGQ